MMYGPRWRRFAAALLVIVATLAAPALDGSRARSQSAVAASVSDIDDSGQLVRAVLTVDQGGRPVADLMADAVTVVDDGEDAPVFRLEPVVDDANPLALILVIDTSGSMSDQLVEVQTAALDLIAQLGPSDAASVIAFASEVAVPLPLTRDGASLQAAIGQLTAAGDTALYDAVVTAAELAHDASFRRRAVVLLTDGQDFGGVSAAERAASLEAAAGAAAFYTVGVGPSVDGDYLGELAAETGGRFFPASTSTEIAEIYATIEELLRSQYILEFERGDAARGEDRTLQVTVDVDGVPVVATADYVSAAPVVVPPPAATVEIAPPAITTPVPEAGAPAAAAEAADGASPLRATLFLVVAALLAGAGVLLLRRRGRPRKRRASLVTASPRLDERPIAPPVASRPGAISGRLTAVTAGEPRFVDLGTAPVTIGSGANSQLQLDPSTDSAPAHARVWIRDGRVMVHHLAAGFETCINGRPIEWAVLSDGDELQIGPQTVTYNAGASEPAMASPGGA